jgi:cellulose synthase/poly-beta-1,6-N-acetylglucosamine synthase-like glycosyltransferase
MKLSVLVPSYRRPVDLQRCLQALSAQVLPADQILVVARTGDDETIEVVRNWSGRWSVELVEVTSSGVVHALNAGLARCSGEILAITDDDAAPRPDWLQRLEKYYADDPTLGGVGGRDWMHINGEMDSGAKTTVGRFLWFGRMVGNHHRGVGPAREVDILKGANWSFRTAAIRPIGFDTRLRGAGAQVYNEVLACLAVKRAGWRLVYDPAVAVDHFPAPRFDRDRRGQFDPIATADRAFNLHLALLEISPAWRRYAALGWQRIYGTRDEPGLISLLLLIARRDRHAFSRYRAARGAIKEGS